MGRHFDGGYLLKVSKAMEVACRGVLEDVKVAKVAKVSSVAKVVLVSTVVCCMRKTFLGFDVSAVQCTSDGEIGVFYTCQSTPALCA
jgi:hypothetical protein